ncbi:MAG: hypothetical protein ACOCVR_02405, partial [Myxococcota bacterium]
SLLDVGDYEITVTADNGVEPAAEQVFTITVEAPAAVALAGAPLSESFGETVPAGWFADGDWQFGAPVVGPAAAYEGDHLAGTVLDGNYTDSSFSSMLSPVVDLTGIDDAVLRFAHWYDIESDYDGGNIKVSVDGGATFRAVDEANVVPAYDGAVGVLGDESAFTGDSGGWVLVEVDLATELENDPIDQVVLSFDFAADFMTNMAGWYIDAVEIGSALDMDLVDIAGFDFEGDTADASIAATGVTVGPFTNALSTINYYAGNPGDAIAANGWDQDDNYWEFVVTPDAGTSIELYDLVFDDQASGTGPTAWEVLLVDEAGTETSIATGSAHGGFTSSPMNVVSFETFEGPYTEAITIRIRGTGASASGGTWRLDNVMLAGFLE